MQVDLDPAALNHHRVVDAPVVGDAAVVAAEFARLLDEVSFTPTEFAARAAQPAGQDRGPETGRAPAGDARHR